jgi:hypothetical protein
LEKKVDFVHTGDARFVDVSGLEDGSLFMHYVDEGKGEVVLCLQDQAQRNSQRQPLN